MKVVTMIKALIIVHLWSLVIASGAWILQHDGKARVGTNFPAPNIWFLLIIFCFLPGALFFVPFGKIISMPATEVFEIFSAQVSDVSADSAKPLNFSVLYIGLCLLLMGRTLWNWLRLQSLPLAETAEPDIFSTSSAIPPLTLSWPRRGVVMPKGLEAQAALIRHERAHLRHYDAEFTLLLLLLQDLMLRNPGISFLVRQWRLSIELRADRAAIKKLTARERKDYAALLLNIQRPTTRRNDALPCPTAQFNSRPHRDAKMRLIGIMEEAPNPRKRRWGAALFFTSVGAGTLGLTSAMAAAGASVIDMASSPVEYVKQTQLQLAASCPGLMSDLKARGIKFEEENLTLNGQLVSQYTVKLGTVVLSHDVRRNGTIYNSRVLDSSHPCFEADAKAAIAQWMTEPQKLETKNVAVKLHFKMSATTSDELNDKLKNYLQ